MRKFKPIIGILLIVVSISGLIVWEKWGKDKLLYDEVLVLRENVEEGTVITESMLTAKKMSIDEDYISFDERKTVLGKETAVFIHKGVPLFSEYFRFPLLSPSVERGDYVLALPQESILSMPESLSRGDRLFLFYKTELLTSVYVSKVELDEGVEVIVKQNQAMQISKVLSAGGRLVLAYQ